MVLKIVLLKMAKVDLQPGLKSTSYTKIFISALHVTLKNCPPFGRWLRRL
jgi:hypothetical protein